MTKRLWLAALGGAVLVGGVAGAQVPPDIAAKIRAAGPSLDPSVGQLYAPMFGKETWAGVTVSRDIAYGSDPLQKLDVFAPTAKHARLPVLLFVHGGGFTRGDKHGPFYPDNVTLWAAKHGMVGVNINYRLAPANPWPAGADDLARAVIWTRANAAKFGGDPNRIVLFGHSAGANHVADYVAHPEVRGTEFASVRGAILLSPNYAPALGPRPNAYYGSDAAVQTLGAQIDRLRHSPVPLFIGYAEFDPPPMKATASTMIAQLCAAKAHCPDSVLLKDHNHLSEGMALGTPDQSLSGPLLAWMKRLR